MWEEVEVKEEVEEKVEEEHLTLCDVWFNTLLNRGALGKPTTVSTLIHSDWFPMRSPSHHALHHPIQARLGPKSLSLHHGHLPDRPLSFRTTGHCKYRF